MKVRPRFILLIVLLLSLSACPRPQHPSLIGDNFLPGETDREKFLWSVITERADKMQSFRASARLRVMEGKASAIFQQVIVFFRPDRFRLEISASSLQKLVHLFVAKEGTLMGFDNEEFVLYQGSASVENIQKLLSLPFSLEQSMLWFCGRFLLPKDGEGVKSALATSPDGEQEVLRLTYQNGRRVELRFEGRERVLLTGLRLEEKGRTIFTEYLYKPGLDVPEAIKLVVPERDLVLFIEYDLVIENPAIASTRLFEIRIPKGVKIEKLD